MKNETKNEKLCRILDATIQKHLMQLTADFSEIVKTKGEQRVAALLLRRQAELYYCALVPETVRNNYATLATAKPTRRVH